MLEQNRWSDGLTRSRRQPGNVSSGAGQTMLRVGHSARTVLYTVVQKVNHAEWYRQIIVKPANRARFMSQIWV